MPARPGRPLIALTMGDLNGIGPEIALKAALSRRVRAACTPVLVGSRAVFEQTAARGRTATEFRSVASAAECANGRALPLIDVPGRGRAVRPAGAPSAAAGTLAALSIATAVRLCLTGEVQALVTAPLSKEAFRKAGYPFPGQTEFLARLCRQPSYAMMLVAGRFRVGLATI